jgi:ribokinase
MTRFDIVGFGALNVDKLFKVNAIAAAEEEGFIEAHEEQCGGSAANASVGLARLGCKVGFIGKVGGDKEGNTLLEDFRKEGVDTGGIVCAKYGESGIVMGFVDREGQRALYIHSGVNDAIAFEEVNLEYVAQAKFLHLSSFVGEKSFLTQKRLLNTLPNNVKVSFDPGALYAQKGYRELASIIEKSYVMMPNAKELEQITGEADPQKGAAFLLAKGVKVVAVKLGERGCFVTDGEEQHAIEAFRTGAVDTTGAGDAFCAGFLYGLLNSKSLLECARTGNFVASRKITKIGARAGLPYKKDLEFLGHIVE